MKHFEFWNPRVFETPYYLYLGYLCLKNRLGIRDLAKANYALDHGEIGIGSKFATQMAFDQQHFLPTEHLPASLDEKEKIQRIALFGKAHGYPIILKPDAGCVGKGIKKILSEDDVSSAIQQSLGDLIMQQFTPYNVEYGVFYVRHSGQASISGINRKHFPCVLGDGASNLLTLAHQDERYTEHWNLFLQYLDMQFIPKKGHTVQLSFIGSHTMGCKFTNDTHLLTDKLEQSIYSIVENQSGFNFGRLDVKCESEEAFLRGEFVVIEINGVASLPTHMFDPDHTLQQAYAIFMEHARHLVACAKEQKHQEMTLLPFKDLLTRVKCNQSELNALHQRILRGQ